MQIIPIDPVPAQTLSVILAGQNVALNIAQRASGMYIDVYLPDVQSAPILAGVVCQNINRIIRNAYFGFLGDLIFIDNSGGDDDPYYTGLGTRWSLAYLSVDELAGADG